MKNEFANNRSTITLIQDGWSSVRNDPIIAHSIHNGKTPYLISAIESENYEQDLSVITLNCTILITLI